MSTMQQQRRRRRRFQFASGYSSFPVRFVLFFLTVAVCGDSMFASKATIDDASRSATIFSSKRFRHLLELAAKYSIIPIDGVKFRDYVQSSSPRNYSFVVLYTAMAAHRRCSVCATVRDEFEMTVRSFYDRLIIGENDEPLFFGYADFDKNGDVFRLANVNTVPHIVYYGAQLQRRPTTSTFRKRAAASVDRTRTASGSGEAMDLKRYGYSAEAISKWLAERNGVEFKILRPPASFGTFALLVLFFVGSIVIYFRYENVEFFNNRTIWGVSAIAFCLLMTSGQMWNHIRGPPIVTRTANGEFNYVHASSHGQFIGETYMVFLLNAGITVTVIVLIDNGYTDSCTRRGNKLIPLGCVIVAGLLFHGLLTIFRTKASNYPYRGLL